MQAGSATEAKKESLSTLGEKLLEADKNRRGEPHHRPSEQSTEVSTGSGSLSSQDDSPRTPKQDPVVEGPAKKPPQSVADTAPPAVTPAPLASAPILRPTREVAPKASIKGRGCRAQKSKTEQTWAKIDKHRQAARAGALAGAGIGYFASQLVIASLLSPPLIILTCVLLTVLFAVGGACLGAEMGAWMAQKPHTAVARHQDLQAPPHPAKSCGH